MAGIKRHFQLFNKPVPLALLLYIAFNKPDNMRWIAIICLLIAFDSRAQLWKDYKLNANNDTLNRIDMKDRKQGPWVVRYESVRGEPGYEEEGWYKYNRKDGEWRLFSLEGDLVGVENYKWGMKDGNCKYYTRFGQLKLEQTWKAMNPDKEYDTLEIEDLDKLDSYRTVIVKNEGAALRHGQWKYYDTESGTIIRTENYVLGKLEGEPSTNTVTTEKKPAAKPQAILDFEKKNAGKKKIKVRDGSTRQ